MRSHNHMNRRSRTDNRSSTSNHSDKINTKSGHALEGASNYTAPLRAFYRLSTFCRLVESPPCSRVAHVLGRPLVVHYVCVPIRGIVEG
jgi:hypothetical protein